MAFSLKHYRHRLILLADLLTIVGSYYLAFLLRFDFSIPPNFLESLFIVLPLFVSVKLPLFFGFKLYQGMWRYTSLYDVLNIIKATAISAIILFGLLHLLDFMPLIPRSIVFLDFGISTVLLMASRTIIRIYYTHFNHAKEVTPGGKMRRLLIIGAGSAGEQLLREINNNFLLNYNVVGFLDDDPLKRTSRIHGVPVIAKISALPDLTMPYDEILIAIPTASSTEMRKIVALCKQTNKSFKTLPGMEEIINGKVSLNTIREVSIADLIGREEVQLDREAIDGFLKHKKVLITGAGGSIGSELVRQCLSYSPHELILLDNSEFNLFSIEKECLDLRSETQITAMLADVRDNSVLEQIFMIHKPQIVLHAAAYKHVPMQEKFPWQAVNTNVRGTKNIINVSEAFGVEKFILVSTDKAVRPTSVMGATKRLAELLIHENGVKRRTKFMAVRFGNVIGSSGSVIPTFKEQIQSGGPVTVTHPEITRFFMSIPEAAQLILQAGSIGNGGEIFLLKMGNPMKIDTIARELIKLSGYTPDVEIPIVYTGLRPGEKMYEELMTGYEKQLPTKHQKILALQSDYNQLDTHTLERELEDLFFIASMQNRDQILKKISQIIPVYQPWSSNGNGNGNKSHFFEEKEN